LHLIKVLLLKFAISSRCMGALSHWTGYRTCLSDLRDLECVIFDSFFFCFLKVLEDLGANLVKPYKINDRLVDQTLDLKHGKSIRSFLMDKVSNGPFQPVSLPLVIATTI
jgi:hypothetical protein